MKSKKVTIYQLTFMAMMAAVTCILGPLSVPIGQIPISLTNLVIYFTVFVLGPPYLRRSIFSRNLMLTLRDSRRLIFLAHLNEQERVNLPAIFGLQ